MLVVKAERLGAAATQTDLAELMNARGFSWRQSTVNRIETGLRPITWDEAVALAALLRIDLGVAAETRDALLIRRDDLRRQADDVNKQWLAAEQQLAELDEREERISLDEYMQTKFMETVAKQAAKPAARAKKQRKAR